MFKIDKYGGNEQHHFKATGFFRLEKTDNRWWLVDPEGNGFITIGLNHADETNLKYPHNFDIWKSKYGSRENWIREGVVKDLKDWGFNTIGWTQELISSDQRHSREWPVSDYETANMPFCIHLNIAEIEDWNRYPLFQEVFSEEFDSYCEYTARKICTYYTENKNLIGYFLVDSPAWVRHESGKDFPAWARHESGKDCNVLAGLSERARNTKLYDISHKYYDTITKYIRKYDPNHLILGDRYNGNRGIPQTVLCGMKYYVDVLSVNYIPENTGEANKKFIEQLSEWQSYTEKPVIIADMANWCPTKLNPDKNKAGIETQTDRADEYISTINSFIKEPWFLGWHWSGYVENTARGWGIKDPWDKPYEEFINPVREFNKAIYNNIKL